ncbi:transcriptional regulator, LuxR family [Shimia sagamensis]|uniref:Transcriptional regulator, LuxR family n=1 Tax=Shimia sagamensis TaxID=1566352 RepID=A0ABY1N616_9RHOB|nr:transcriptional regulator, LuxR family [Shimia sagamensis]
MKQQKLHPPFADVNMAVDQVIRLSQTVGSENFIQAVMRVATETCGADFVSLFCQGDRDTPLLIGTACRLGQRRAAQAAKGYRRHVHVDGNTAILSGSQGIGDFLTYQSAGDIPSFTYRRDCYDLPGISERVSVVRRAADYGLSISLYASDENGPFDAPHGDKIQALFRLLLALTERHVAFSLKDGVWMENDVQARLALSYPDLTPREREVAAMAIKGRTAKESADLLGVAETTIITHRKKAYKRMNVTSLRQLMASY